MNRLSLTLVALDLANPRCVLGVIVGLATGMLHARLLWQASENMASSNGASSSGALGMVRIAMVAVLLTVAVLFGQILSVAMGWALAFLGAVCGALMVRRQGVRVVGVETDRNTSHVTLRLRDSKVVPAKRAKKG